MVFFAELDLINAQTSTRLLISCHNNFRLVSSETSAWVENFIFNNGFLSEVNTHVVDVDMLAQAQTVQHFQFILEIKNTH